MDAIKSFWIFLLLLAYSLTAQAGHSLTVIYRQPVNSGEAEIKSALETSGAIAEVSTFINENFKLPKPLVIEVGGDDGPLYDGESTRIIIPYGFVADTKARFSHANYAKESGISLEIATRNAMMHTLLHEFAHAAIHLYELPVLGKEEDAADALATTVLIEFFEDGREIVLSAADLFDLESADRDEIASEDFWDEHSLDEQRYYTALCHVYGSDPEEYSFLSKEAGFSKARAELCIEEYQTISLSWIALLQPYVKK